MQFTVLAIAAFTAFTSAAAIDKRAPSDVCPSIDTPQCCQLDVDGVVDATCASRSFFPSPPSLLSNPQLTISPQPATSPPSTTSTLLAPRLAPTAMCCTIPVVSNMVLLHSTCNQISLAFTSPTSDTNDPRQDWHPSQQSHPIAIFALSSGKLSFALWRLRRRSQAERQDPSTAERQSSLRLRLYRQSRSGIPAGPPGTFEARSVDLGLFVYRISDAYRWGGSGFLVIAVSLCRPWALGTSAAMV
ncbi:hypothetical protein L1887_62814 [Cichorium endivia]|nr:hypothetical protein L1887_62814 [Cichorium endivia]